jgi:signal transduction histidine kinase
VAVQQCVYRVAQEALENVARHAQAHSVQINLLYEKPQEQIQLDVIDDGCGFDPGASFDDEKYGLRGMRERVEVIGGRLEVASKPGEGTRVSMIYGLR